MSPFGAATSSICFKLWLTLPVNFKARVDAPLLSFAHNDPESQLLLPRLDPCPNFIPWSITRVIVQWHETAGRFEPTTPRS